MCIRDSVNDAPHVGHAYATVNADALARWHRLIGDDVFFLTGTDEHGAKVAEAAAERGVAPAEWTDITSERFRGAWRGLEVSNDDFIRTTEARHHATVQEFLQRIYDNGFIELGTYRGLYCVSCEDYYTEEQLVDGKCPVHGRPVIEMQEDNYFFKLSAFEQRLIEWYESAPDAVRPAGKRNEALRDVYKRQPRVRADLSVDWPTWSQTNYRSWSIGVTPDELPEVVIDCLLYTSRCV